MSGSKTTLNGSRISRRQMLSYGLVGMVGVAGGSWPVSAFGDANKMHATQIGGRSAPLRCSFCDKHERDAEYLIVHDEVGICEACVAICSSIISVHDATKNQERLALDDDEESMIPHRAMP